VFATQLNLSSALAALAAGGALLIVVWIFDRRALRRQADEGHDKEAVAPATSSVPAQQEIDAVEAEHRLRRAERGVRVRPVEPAELFGTEPAAQVTTPAPDERRRTKLRKPAAAPVLDWGDGDTPGRTPAKPTSTAETKQPSPPLVIGAPTAEQAAVRSPARPSLDLTDQAVARRVEQEIERSRRRAGRRRNSGGHVDGSNEADVGRPRLPRGAEAALASILEVVPDPRNVVKLTRDPTAEVHLTRAEREAVSSRPAR
jgi:hypothetical protein